MLPKNRRISREEFNLLGKGGSNSFRPKVLHSPLVSLFVYPQVESSGVISTNKPSKFAFSVSKKVSKSAVVRNKLRRWGYATIRKFLPYIGEGMFYTFVFKKGADANNYQEVENEIKGLMKRD